MKRFVIWGTKECGEKVYEMITSRCDNAEVVGFADSDSEKQGKELHNLIITSPQQAIEDAKNGKIDAVIFAFLNKYQRDMTRLFRDVEVEAYVVPTHVQRFEDTFDSIEKCLVKIDLNKPRMKQFDVNLVDHCNMKCKGCLRFSNLVDTPAFADFDTMVKDWKRIKELFWGVERIKLMGGEPLLSPDLCKYIDVVRSIFPDSDIMVTTNAILINEKCTELFETMKRNNCFFDISLYAPMEKRLPEIERILSENHVWYKVNYSKDDFYKVMSKTPDYDADEMYEVCMAKNCHHLREGKISVCSRPQYSHIINERYGVSLPTDCGVWDIHEKNIDAWELDKNLSSSFESCKYCAPPVSYEWGRADSKTAEYDDWFVV